MKIIFLREPEKRTSSGLPENMVERTEKNLQVY